MSVWRNTRGQKWKCNKKGKKQKKSYRQKYTTTEQTISQNYKVTDSATNAPHGRTENEKS